MTRIGLGAGTGGLGAAPAGDRFVDEPNRYDLPLFHVEPEWRSRGRTGSLGSRTGTDRGPAIPVRLPQSERLHDVGSPGGGGGPRTNQPASPAIQIRASFAASLPPLIRPLCRFARHLGVVSKP